MNSEQLESFLASAKPYHFTIHNECSDLASATINLESLNAEAEKQLEDEYIDAILYETDYHTNINSEKQLNESMYNDENKVISDAKHAYRLYNFSLKPDETRDFNLLLYMDPDTPLVETNMNASWKGKITISTGYKVDSKAIRTISYNDSNGMWGYKDKLTKIVIEDTKSVKEAPEDGKVYGPFDESEYGTKAVQSYVVCDTDDTNCVGYLQSDGKVVANIDSSNLFAYFSNIISIDSLENLDTSKVNKMNSMFAWLNNPTIDFNSLDLSSVTEMNGMFTGSTLQTLDLSAWDVSNIKSMQAMFANVSGLINLDLSAWNVEHVTNMNMIFNRMVNTVNINISNWNLSGLNSSSSPNLFGDSANLETINMTNVIFPKNSSNFFSSNLTNLHNLILVGTDISHVTNMSNMFAGNSSIQELDLSMWDVSNVTDMSTMFFGTTGLKKLNVSNWNLSNYSKGTFLAGNTELNTINMTNFVFPANCDGFFANQLSNLENIILTGSDTSHVTNMRQMFNNCYSLKSLDLSTWDTSQVTNMFIMFAQTSNLQTIIFGSNFVHKPEAPTGHMFDGCQSLDRPTGDTWTDVSFD